MPEGDANVSPQVPPGPTKTPTPVSVPAQSSAPEPDAALKTQKLQLEIRQLQRANSKEYLNLERFKTYAPAAAAFLAFITFIWTVHSGLEQLALTRNGQDQDRLDKALTRLSSQSVTERLTGAAGLSLFLTPVQKDRHSATLRFLATALVIEEEASVRQAILDTFSHIDPIVVGTEARQDALRTLLILNRSAYQAQMHTETIAPSPTTTSTSKPTFREEAIRDSGKAIAILVRKGTSEHDFSQLDCTECDFSSDAAPLDLSGFNFNGTLLENARFSRTKLVGASFAGADLTNADFEGADLRKSRFTGAPAESFSVRRFVKSGDKPTSPNFACADASEADFAGSLFFGFIESNDEHERIAGFPKLLGTNLSGTDLTRLGVYALTLPHSKSKPPFADTKLITYKSQNPAGRYQNMYVAGTSDWRFVTTSTSFERSRSYLETQLQSATNVDVLKLPSPIAAYQKAPPPAFDPSAANYCNKYVRP